MGFRIHPVFTSIEQEQLFLQQFGRSHAIIKESMWEDIFTDELAFHRLMELSEINTDLIRIIHDYLKNLESVVCDDELTKIQNSFDYIMAFLNVSVRLNITWTIR